MQRETVYLYAFGKDENVPDYGALLARHARETGCDCAAERVLFTPRGKPYIASGALHISKTHTDDFTLFALSRKNIGIDAERHRARDYGALAKRFFHGEECAYVTDEASFYAVWTAKESVVKLTGCGIDGTFSRFSVVTDGKIAERAAGVSLMHFALEAGVTCCIACEVPFEIAVMKGAMR